MTAAESRPIHILELRSVRGTGGGPDKTILLGAARTTVAGFALSVCYLRSADDQEFCIGPKARRLGLDYIEINERGSLDLRVWPALRRVVRERAIDIVHGHDYKTDLLAWLLARATGAIPLATAHGWSGDSWRERLYYRVDRRLLRHFPCVIAVSEPIRRTILRHGAAPDRVRRIRNGVDHDRFVRNKEVRVRCREQLGIPADALVLGAVGRLESEKRFDVLIDAATRLSPRPAVPWIVIAGEGSCRSTLERDASAAGVRLRLLGHREDVDRVHQVFDVYVQTSDTEGIPNAVLEAMAVETPIVATDVGGTRELITDDVHGLLAPRRDAPAIARAIEQTLADPAATRRRVAAARARVEQELSFDARMCAVHEIYRELADRGRQSRRRARARPTVVLQPTQIS